MQLYIVVQVVAGEWKPDLEDEGEQIREVREIERGKNRIRGNIKSYRDTEAEKRVKIERKK